MSCRLTARVLALAMLMTSCLAHAQDDILVKAFPSAEGFGACTPGGRGGQVLFVTTLDDYRPGEDAPIPGSLRAAVSAKGPRTIVFRVGGTIDLKADLHIGEPYLTIAGQSAPGGGICLKDYQVVLGTHDVIMRHLRLRSGDLTQKEQMALGIFGGNDSIVDHCSMTWAIDEVMSSFGTVHGLTVQWSIISEGLSKSLHPKGEHSKGSILNGDGGITIHHCIYAHNSARNPRVDTVLLDFRNNIVYDWGYRGAYTREGPTYTNYVANYLKSGPSTRKTALTRLFEPGDDMARLYMKDNILYGRDAETADNRLLIDPPDGAETDSFRESVVVHDAFPAPPVTTEDAAQAYLSVLESAGATLPRRDSADSRLMDEIRSGTGRIIDSPADVGGWPALESGVAEPDGDRDGMPDSWETSHGLDAMVAGSNNDTDKDGYTDLEEFLNATDPRLRDLDARIPAIEFRRLQEDALTLAAMGQAAFKERQARTASAQNSAKEDIIKTLAIKVDTSDPNRVTLDLGGKATLTLVKIPAGSFLMGSPESEGGLERERPQHKVNISRSFYMAETKTTTAQSEAVLGPGVRESKPEDMDTPAPETGWFRAREFCEILSAVTGRTFRLPTEAEWEYACRAGTTTAFNTGDTISTDQANFNGEEATRFNPVGVFRGKKTPVKMFPPNGWGLYDMHGNEAEYCEDRCFRVYTTEEVTDPVGPSEGGARVLRGGKAGSKAAFIRSAYRYGYVPEVGYGFRIVMEGSS